MPHILFLLDSIAPGYYTKRGKEQMSQGTNQYRVGKY